MPLGTSIFLIALGAILRYAVTATVSGISIHTVGLILIIVGIVGLVLSLLYLFAWSPRRGRAARFGLGGLLDARRPTALGARGPAHVARGWICCRPLSDKQASKEHRCRRRPTIPT